MVKSSGRVRRDPRQQAAVAVDDAGHRHRHRGVITMVALGEGAQRSVAARLQTLGANVLTVRPGSPSRAAWAGDRRRSPSRTRRRCGRTQAHPGRGARNGVAFQVEHGADNANLSVVGTWPAYFDINQARVVTGALFTDAEDRGRRRDGRAGALAGAQLGRRTRGPGGRELRIGGIPFEVIGVLAEKGAQGFSTRMRASTSRWPPRSSASWAATACAPSACRRRRTRWMMP